ncbi:MAG: 4-amino-4-deoxy-L-arabinose transferase [Bacteroidetes bacterium]|nr:MAG: 4-amino-4-deoxy-L-arabinose transferase [Bacteroidota bacterium]PTM15096.1 MAG: 4-amino-4-deoxy-L-arabinose transferase [Bacteroidota bacterium]
MISKTNPKRSYRVRSRADITLGLLYLGVDILVSVAAQLVLKNAMLRLGAFDAGAGWLNYVATMALDVEVIGGLSLYGSGMILWILCLSKLDLSLAYPIGTLQYILIFVGAWWLFDEQISPLRLTGMLVICLGAFIMSVDLHKK